MCESSVTFSIKNDINGNIKISCDSSSKKKTFAQYDSSQKLSPCSSMRSFDTTNDSEILMPGIRRRASSTSSCSIVTSDISDAFEMDGVHLRSSTPITEERDFDNLSDVSFASCVSKLSEKSILTDSSQETVKSAVILPSARRSDYSEQSSRWRKKSISYEEKNKERYGGWVEGDWRSAMQPSKTLESDHLKCIREHNNFRSKSPNQCKTPSSANFSPPIHTAGGTFQSNASYNSKSRIPSLKTRPVYKSPNQTRNVPNSTFNNAISSPMTASSQSRSSHISRFSQSSDCMSEVKITIVTDPEGRMKIKFLNNSSEELWIVDGMSGLSDEIDVRLVQVNDIKNS